MQKEIVSSRQFICTMILFIFGSSLVLGVSSQTGQDSWMTLLLAIAYVLPAVLIYSRIIALYPGMDIFDIFNVLFGKFVGKILTVLFTWYAIHLAALVLRNFSEFIQIVFMTETPQLPIMIIMLFVTILMTKAGVEVLGRWSVFVLPVVLGIIALTIVFSIKIMDFSNILPIMNHRFSEISSSSYQLFTFPLAETVLFLAFASSIKKNVSPYKVYVFSILIGAFVLLLVMVRNVEVLGPVMLKQTYFPSYTVAKIIEISDFLQRIEVTISINFMLAGITKISVCLMAASRGMSKLFNIQNYRQVVWPVSLIILALCAIVYDNTMQMFDFLKIYQYYVIPFQIIIPVFVWVAAEIKCRKKSARMQCQKT